MSTTTLTLTEEQAKLLVHILGSAPSAEEDSLERRLEWNEFDSNEELAEAHKKLDDVRALCDDLMQQLLAGPDDLEKKILEVLPTSSWMAPHDLVLATMSTWTRLVPVLKKLVDANQVRESGLGYIRIH